MAHYRDSGVIVRTHKLGEADRILSIITESNGKVRAVAKGVRKTRSKYGGRLELLRHLDLQFYKGRGDLEADAEKPKSHNEAEWEKRRARRLSIFIPPRR